MFFRLLPEVYLVIGKHKSLLQNILNKKIFWIDNNIAKFIKICENNNRIPDEFLQYAIELKNNGWGTITSSPIFVEKLRFLDINDKRQFHKKPLIINHATIKLTDKCNLNCNKCRELFCPSCIKDNKIENLTLEKLKNFILNIKYYGCKTVLLTGGEISLFSSLKEVYDFLIQNNFEIILATNGIKKLDDYFINANIIIPIFQKDLLNTVIKNYKDFKNITICTYFDDNENISLPSTWKHIKRSCLPRKITKKSLASTNIQNYHFKQIKNTCLNGKIVINQAGEIYPCLESIKHIEPVGNINVDSWEKIMDSLLLDYWNKKVDDHNICSNCEFRYTCTSCLFDNVKQNCCYNMEEKTWI